MRGKPSGERFILCRDYPNLTGAQFLVSVSDECPSDRHLSARSDDADIAFNPIQVQEVFDYTGNIVMLAWRILFAFIWAIYADNFKPVFIQQEGDDVPIVVPPDFFVDLNHRYRLVH